MKIIEKINETTMKVAKGMFAIFAIKLIFIGGFFIFQSCQTDSIDNQVQEKAKTSFLTSLTQSKENFNSILVKNSKIKGYNSSSVLARDLQGETVSYCLMEFDDSITTTEEVIGSIENLSDLIQTKTQYNLGLIKGFTDTSTDDNTSESNSDTTNNYFTEDCLSIFELPIQPIVDALEPSIVEAKNYLYSLGLTDAEIAIELGGAEEANLVPVVMALIAAETESSNSVTFNYGAFFGYSLHALNGEPDWYDCMLRAVGIDALIELINGNVTKQIAKKAIRKVVSRTLGWIGAAIAAYEFGSCMEWY